MKKLPDLSFVNGKLENSIPVTDRGLSYGDGLFETILFLNGKPVLLDQHLERLIRDCKRLQINLDENKLKQELTILNSAINTLNNPAGVAKIIITREFTNRGYGYDKYANSNRLLQYFSGLSYPKENQQGVRLSLCDHKLPDNPRLAGIKHLNRLDQVLAQNSIKKPFYHEGIVFGTRSEVIECVSSNIFIIKNGSIFTPSLDKAGVQGVMRETIISVIAPALNSVVQIEKIMLADLMVADEVFICNSVFGVWPVMAIHVKEYLAGKITSAIQQEVNKLGYAALYL